MNVTQNVIHDLLPGYLAGEASSDTVALVEEFLRGDLEMARVVEALRADALPEVAVGLRATHEKETLDMTKKLLRWRGVLMGVAIFMTLLPASFRFERGGVVWTFVQGTSGLAMGLVCLGAVGCWSGFLYVRRRLEGSGL